MEEKNKSMAVAVCKTHTEAELVVKELQEFGFDMKKLSIIGKDYHEEDKVVGFYNIGDSMKKWGERGAFWGGLWGFVFGAGFFFIPGIGPIAMAGPIVSSLVGGLEGATVIGGLSVLGAALWNFGIPKNSIIQYESELKVDKFLVIAHGTSLDIDKAKNIMSKANEIEVIVHH